METEAAAAGGAGCPGAAAFDVESYIGAYEGDTKLKRLEFIAKKVGSADLPCCCARGPLRPVRACSQAAELGNTDTELQACRQLHNLAKQGTNTSIYRVVCAQVPLTRSNLSHVRPELGTRLTVRPVQIGDRLGAEHKLDAAWIAKTDNVSVALLPFARPRGRSDRWF
eukprot:COSAG02_NODE_3509_length_6634_cov_2.750574_1_plen_168_part_00